ncbi:MAG TPA: hypothetical protein VK611_12530 [Acidimicrobiales bacterium]|nr:hypothetical protein [Acidimicrobiales bacterium]
MRSRWPVVALVAWTFFVWTTRIGNIWGDDGLDTAGKVGRTALALSFTFLALAVVGALWRRPSWLRPTVVALAAWTTGVWLVRDTSILFGDHDTSFKIVHTVLAVVSIALSALALRTPAPARTPEPARR